MRSIAGRAATNAVPLVAEGETDRGVTDRGGGFGLAISSTVVSGSGEIEMTNQAIAAKAAIAVNVHAYFLLIESQPTVGSANLSTPAPRRHTILPCARYAHSAA